MTSETDNTMCYLFLMTLKGQIKVIDFVAGCFS